MWWVSPAFSLECRKQRLFYISLAFLRICASEVHLPWAAYTWPSFPFLSLPVFPSWLDYLTLSRSMLLSQSWVPFSTVSFRKHRVRLQTLHLSSPKGLNLGTMINGEKKMKTELGVPDRDYSPIRQMQSTEGKERREGNHRQTEKKHIAMGRRLKLKTRNLQNLMIDWRNISRQ